MRRSSFSAVAALIALLAAEPAVAQQSAIHNPTTYGAPFSVIKTYQEQAELLGLKSSNPQPRASPLKRGTSIYHVKKAKSLLDEMEGLKPDGTRSGSAFFKKIQFHLESARFAGMSYESALEEIYRSSSTAPDLIRLRKQNLLNAMKFDRELGLLTPANLQRLERGYAPLVTKGNPKYIGEVVEVDHAIPIGGPNGRPIYENEVANLRMLPISLNREKSANVDHISQGREAKLDRAYLAERNVITSGVLNAGVGIVLVYTSTKDILANLKSGPRDLLNNLRLIEQSSSLIAGGSFAAEGIGFIANVKSLAQMGGRIVMPVMIVMELSGVVVDTFQWNNLTHEQKYVALIKHGSNAMLIGAMLDKEPYSMAALYVLGGVGNVTANILGRHFAGVEEFDQKRQIRDFIYQHYGVGDN
jgi:hypothetical protein